MQKKWNIEVMHKKLKSNLGIKELSDEKEYGFIRYWAFVFLVCSILCLMKLEYFVFGVKRTIREIMDFMKKRFQIEKYLNLIESVVSKDVFLLIIYGFKNAKV